MLYALSRLGKKGCTDCDTIAIFSSLENATKTVEENGEFLFECRNIYIVIEPIKVDELYGGMLNERHWFKWDGDKYVACPEPEAFKNALYFWQ